MATNIWLVEAIAFFLYLGLKTSAVLDENERVQKEMVGSVG